MINNPTLNSPIKAYDEEQTEFLNTIKDYVIETGNNANGNWEKWASGKLVQSGRVEVVFSSGFGSKWGELYFTEFVRATFPIPFVGLTPVVNMTLGSSGGGGEGFQVLRSNENIYQTQEAYLVRPTASPSSSGGYIRYDAIGRWK